jgi:hypothetical protein
MNIDEMTKQLPSGWNIWQMFDGRVCLQIRKGDLVANLDADTITEAVAKGVAHKFLPEIYRRPQLFIAAHHEPVKASSGKWFARNISSGRDLGFALSTRKAVVESLEKWEARSREGIAEYDRKFAEMFPNGGVEGVDFVYSR